MENNKGFKVAFMFYNILSFLSFFAGCTLGFITFSFNIYGLLIVLIYIIIFTLFVFIFWKCPNCKHILPVFKSKRHLKNCGNCGFELIRN